MELFKASQQWSTRPADERYTSLESMYQDTKAYADAAREKEVDYADLRVEASDGQVQVTGKAGIPAKLTNWAFGQLAARVGAPASYLRDLPATLAAQNLNHGLANRVSSGTAKLLFHQNGSLLLRALTSERYERIWNHEVIDRLIDTQAQGWEPARPDIRLRGNDAPALYASDHDMFAFMRSPNAVSEHGAAAAMWRGVIVENSEVGASALKMTRFLYREMCGNHIIWGASEVMDLSVRHVGEARERWENFAVQVRKWADSSPSEEETMIERSRHAIIAGTKSDVLDAVFGKRSLGLSRKVLDAGYDACIPDLDGSPNTTWGLVQGITRHSQTIPYADERNRIDRAAGKILEVTF